MPLSKAALGSWHYYPRFAPGKHDIALRLSAVRVSWIPQVFSVFSMTFTKPSTQNPMRTRVIGHWSLLALKR
jgi:hypothetical protein